MTAPSLIQVACCGQTCGQGTGQCVAHIYGAAILNRIERGGYVVLPAPSETDPHRDRQCQPSQPGNVPPSPQWQLGRIELQPAGCICPPGAEAGCKGPMCPGRLVTLGLLKSRRSGEFSAIARPEQEDPRDWEHIGTLVFQPPPERDLPTISGTAAPLDCYLSPSPR